MSASERSPGNQTVIFSVTSSRAPRWCPSGAACTPTAKRMSDATTIRAGYNAAQTHKDADAILALTPARRVYSPPRVRPQQRLFRLIERLDLDLDLDLGDVWGGVCGLSKVHDAGRASVLRQQEKGLEGAGWQCEPGARSERFWMMSGDCRL